MTRVLSGVFAFLLPFLAYSADLSSEAAPPADVSVWPMIIVAFLFVAMIGGFLFYIWWKERERKQRESKS